MMIDVTRVDVRLATPRDDDKLLAYASVIFSDQFIVHNFKVIIGKSGQPFVCMPSRKVFDRCPECQGKNPLTHRYCGRCGADMGEYPPTSPSELHEDTAHPLTLACRDYLSSRVLEAYNAEAGRLYGNRQGVIAEGRSRDGNTHAAAAGNSQQHSAFGKGILDETNGR